MDEEDVILTALRPVVEGLAATFGRSCEVVLHDYRRTETSVVAVAGDVTGRTPGGAMSEIGMAILAKGDAAANDLNYVTRTPGGTVVKSSTLPLKTSDGRLFGALCVNLDVTALHRAQDLLGELAGAAPQQQPPTTTFSDDFAEVVDAVVRGAEHARGKAVADLSRGERLLVVQDLDTKGLLRVRGSAPRIAAALGISRASLYADLAEVRNTTTEPR